MNARNEDFTREQDVLEMVEKHRSQTPAGVRTDSVEVRPMTDEERSLEARLQRSLTPVMRERLREALKA
ncbi:MAG: hypothetical protein D6692_05305 [Planctomycetota bacterium]|nr:MAG: hypothetical protein D6692_05305 [Planctomycetota bacterium]